MILQKYTHSELSLCTQHCLVSEERPKDFSHLLLHLNVPLAVEEAKIARQDLAELIAHYSPNVGTLLSAKGSNISTCYLFSPLAAVISFHTVFILAPTTSDDLCKALYCWNQPITKPKINTRRMESKVLKNLILSNYVVLGEPCQNIQSALSHCMANSNKHARDLEILYNYHQTDAKYLDLEDSVKMFRILADHLKRPIVVFDNVDLIYLPNTKEVIGPPLMIRRMRLPSSVFCRQDNCPEWLTLLQSCQLNGNDCKQDTISLLEKYFSVQYKPFDTQYFLREESCPLNYPWRMTTDNDISEVKDEIEITPETSYSIGFHQRQKLKHALKISVESETTVHNTKQSILFDVDRVQAFSMARVLVPAAHYLDGANAMLIGYAGRCSSDDSFGTWQHLFNPTPEQRQSLNKAMLSGQKSVGFGRVYYAPCVEFGLPIYGYHTMSSVPAMSGSIVIDVETGMWVGTHVGTLITHGQARNLFVTVWNPMFINIYLGSIHLAIPSCTFDNLLKLKSYVMIVKKNKKPEVLAGLNLTEVLENIEAEITQRQCNAQKQ